jgi:hypothetical protein
MTFTILQATAGNESFFDSPLWRFVTLMTQAVLVALWLALVFWTYKDAKRRMSDPLMIGVSVATSLIFPFVGALFYTILRPPEYLDDVLERDLEIRAREHELGGVVNRCTTCGGPVRDDFLSCPHCEQKLKSPCDRCKSPLDPSWKICPYCESRTGSGARLSGTRRGMGSESNTRATEAEDELFA